MIMIVILILQADFVSDDQKESQWELLVPLILVWSYSWIFKMIFVNMKYNFILCAYVCAFRMNFLNKFSASLYFCMQIAFHFLSM